VHQLPGTRPRRLDAALSNHSAPGSQSQWQPTRNPRRNTWWNRLLADQVLPKEKRLTRTNVTPKAGGKPLPSGLFGPFRILTPAD
jgi:hypothetical protein